MLTAFVLRFFPPVLRTLLIQYEHSAAICTCAWMDTSMSFGGLHYLLRGMFEPDGCMSVQAQTGALLPRVCTRLFGVQGGTCVIRSKRAASFKNEVAHPWLQGGGGGV